MTKSNPISMSFFCPQCFATDKDGSMGGTLVVDQDGHGTCSNCCTLYGGGAGAPLLPDHQIQAIREQASWIGKRYYPALEDGETAAEMQRMRNVLKLSFPFPPGRRAEQQSEGAWLVTQRTHTSSKSQFIQANSAEEALLKSWETTLPFYAEDPRSPSYNEKMHQEKK